MIHAICLTTLLWVSAPQDDVAEAVRVFEKYVDALQKKDYRAAAELIHPSSLQKLKSMVTDGLDQRAENEQAAFAEMLGYKSWKEVKAAEPVDFYARFFENLGAMPGMSEVMGAIPEATFDIIGALSKSGKVYIVAEMTMPIGDGRRIIPVLHVAYKHGGTWKLANRGEADIAP